MSRVILGKYVNTHGIKGEIRIKSNFPYKDKVFQNGKKIIIYNQEYTINSYRIHKGYDMVTLKEINNINDIPFPKNINVYINREEYLLKNEYVDSDLIGFIVYNSKLDLTVRDILYLNDKKKLLDCDGKLIPFELIEKIDLENKKIQIMEVDGL